MDTGTTRGGPYFPQEEAAGPSPAPLTQITTIEQRKYKHLFDLMDSLAPLIAIMDRLEAKFSDVASPPDFVTRAWIFPETTPGPGELAVKKRWPNWPALRADYQKAVNEIMASYQGVGLTGLGSVLAFAILSVITVVAVAAVVYNYISEQRGRPPQAVIMDAGKEAGLNPTQINDAVNAYNALKSRIATVAKDNNISLPTALAKISSNIVKIALIVAAGYLAYEYMRK